MSLTFCDICAICVSELSADKPKSGKKDEFEGVDVIEMFSAPNDTLASPPGVTSYESKQTPFPSPSLKKKLDFQKNANKNLIIVKIVNLLKLT